MKGCTICASSRMDEVNRLLDGGASIRAVAAKTGFGRNSVHAHSRHHAQDGGGNAAKAAKPDGVRQQILRAAKRLLQRAERAGDYAAGLRALDQITALERESQKADSPRTQTDAPIIRVVYDYEGRESSRLTPAARQHYLGQLVLNELPPETTPENILAGAALVVSYLQRTQLPPEVAEEVRKILEAEKEKSHGAL